MSPHPDPTNRPEHAPEVVMDAHGFYWRRWPDGTLSIPPTSTNNDPMAEPLTIYRVAAKDWGSASRPVPSLSDGLDAPALDQPRPKSVNDPVSSGPTFFGASPVPVSSGGHEAADLREMFTSYGMTPDPPAPVSGGDEEAAAHPCSRPSGGHDWGQDNPAGAPNRHVCVNCGEVHHGDLRDAPRGPLAVPPVPEGGDGAVARARALATHGVDYCHRNCRVGACACQDAAAPAPSEDGDAPMSREAAQALCAEQMRLMTVVQKLREAVTAEHDRAVAGFRDGASNGAVASAMLRLLAVLDALSASSDTPEGREALSAEDREWLIYALENFSRTLIHSDQREHTERLIARFTTEGESDHD